LRDHTSLATIGATSDAGFPVPSVGLGFTDFESFIMGQHPLCSTFAKAKKPNIVLSSSLFDTSFKERTHALLDIFQKVSPFLAKSINVINLNASSVGAFNSGRLSSNVAEGAS
jgi:hypothetical protein